MSFCKGLYHDSVPYEYNAMPVYYVMLIRWAGCHACLVMATLRIILQAESCLFKLEMPISW